MSVSQSPKRSQETLALHTLWKAAAKADKPIEIPCGSEKNAIRRRFTFYSAVRKVKDNPALDPELFSAIENVMIFFKEGDKTTLCLGQKPAPEDLLQVVAGLGIDLEAQDKRDAVEKGMEDSAARVMQMTGQAPAAPTPTPKLPEGDLHAPGAAKAASYLAGRGGPK